MDNVNNFIRNLHPEEVEHRLAAIRDEIQERSRHSEVMVSQPTGQQSQQQSQMFIKQLEADKKELLELDKLMGVLKNIALESSNMLLNQGQQLRVGA